MRKGLRAEEVSAIKRRIVDGDSLSTIADRYRIGYMAIYKIAIGETWQGVEPKGRLIVKTDRTRITRKQRDKLYEVKLKTGLSNAALARKAKRPESSVSKAIREAHMLRAAIVHRLLLTSGSHDVAMERYDLTESEANDLVTFSASHRIPDSIRQEAERAA